MVSEQLAITGDIMCASSVSNSYKEAFSLRVNLSLIEALKR